VSTASYESTGEKEVLKDFFVISADAHVNEPHDLWATRIDKKFRDRVPSIKVDEQGRKWFVIEGLRPSRIREAPRDAQVSVEDFKKRVQEADGERPHLDKTVGAMFQKQGGFDRERYLDLDYDGVDAEIVFPNKGLTNWQSPDPEHNVAMCRVWNDWAHEMFSGSKRSYPMACAAPADVPAAVEEIERVAKLGFHGVMLPPLVRNSGYNSRDYDPIWAALTAAKLPVCFHAGTGKDPRTASGDGGAIINYVVHAMNTVLQPTVELCASGVFERFPTLQFATIEAGAGWIPYALYAMDFGERCHAYWVSPKLKERPSDYFRRHGHASFETDPIGAELRHHLGPDVLMWGNDYPHLEGSWPHSSGHIENWSAGMTHEEKGKVLGLTAAKLFNLDVPERFRA
jgi:predicted TIM-barrel fold metal-dependent hydrolase